MSSSSNVTKTADSWNNQIKDRRWGKNKLKHGPVAYLPISELQYYMKLSWRTNIFIIVCYLLLFFDLTPCMWWQSVLYIYCMCGHIYSYVQVGVVSCCTCCSIMLFLYLQGVAIVSTIFLYWDTFTFTFSMDLNNTKTRLPHAVHTYIYISAAVCQLLILAWS
jgi:hypothetical protein